MGARRLRRIGALVMLALAGSLLPVVVATSAPAAVVGAGSTFTRLPGFSLPHGHHVRVSPRHYSAYRLDVAGLRRTLAAAPSGGALARGATPLTVTVPDPGGTPTAFRVQETSVMQPGLAARHPELRTYAGRGVDDPTQTVRMDVTPMGFHASVRSPGGTRAWYVDPAYDVSGTTTHLSYYGASVPRPDASFVERDPADTARALAAAPSAAPGAEVQRRTFRLAMVTDPTYAAYFGTANVAAEKVTLINRVNQVYNDDLGIRLVLVDGTDALNLDTLAKATGANGPCGASACFAATDLETCSPATLARNEFVLGQLVGADTFDVGHIGLGVDGGGIAGLGVVGTVGKADGCTGLSFPEGDFYAIDYVAHELGHQFGGNHTFNGTQGSCSLGNRNPGTSVEPGSGSSVMAYAGICGTDDLQPHTDPYFSQRSIDEITATASAASANVNEWQTITLRGFDTNGETIQLRYGTNPPVTLTRGAATYNATTVLAAVQQLTGFTPTVLGYDGAPAPGNNGFQLRFGAASGAGGLDVARIGVSSTSSGVSGFTGVERQGGPETNGGTENATGNHAPTITAPADRTIPTRTPFTLTATGADSDGDALTYLWEQNDQGGATTAGGAPLVTNTKQNGPLFRVFGEAADVSFAASLESPSPGENVADGRSSRTFPDLVQVLSGNTNAKTGTCPTTTADPVPSAIVDCYSEFLPTSGYGTTTHQLHFRVTGRDGSAAGGGTSHDDVTLTVATTSGPFLVTSRGAAGGTATAGATETVTWTVNGTNAATMAPDVRISLSTDGGASFPHELAASTPNDGSADVTLPAVNTDHARLRIEAVDNYFFDVNDADFRIDTSIDTTPPDTEITGGPVADSFQLGSAVTMRYAATEAGSTFDCSLDGASVACVGDRVRLSGLVAGTHVFRVAARDAHGNLDPTPAVRRFATPFAATQLTRETGGWTLRHATASYRGDYLQTSAAGQRLARKARGVGAVALVAGTGPGYGRVAVFLGTTRLRTVSLASASTHARVLIPIATLASTRNGKLVIRTLDRKRVRVEGLGILTR